MNLHLLYSSEESTMMCLHDMFELLQIKDFRMVLFCASAFVVVVVLRQLIYTTHVLSQFDNNGWMTTLPFSSYDSLS